MTDAPEAGILTLNRRALNYALLIVASAVWLLAATVGAFAHPHVWVTISSEIIYGPDGKLTGIRHAWTFDEIFSTFATQGLKQAKRGTFTRGELAPLAEQNLSSLKEYGYFTVVKINGKKVPFREPTDYWLEYRNGALTLRFLLPLQTPANPQRVVIEVYDPTWFVDFGLAGKDPVTLTGAPATCTATIQSGKSTGLGAGLTEEFFNSLTASSNWGAQLANRILVKCPDATAIK